MPKKTQSFMRTLMCKDPNPSQTASPNVSRSYPQTSSTEPESIVEYTKRSISNTQKDKQKKPPAKVVGWHRRKGDHNPINYRIKLDDSLKDHELYARVTEFPPKKLSKAQKQKEAGFQRGFQAGLAAQGGSVSRSGGSVRSGGSNMEMPTGSSLVMSGGPGVPHTDVAGDGTGGGGPGFLAPGGGFERGGSNSGNFAPGGFSNSADRTNRRTG